MRRTPDTSRAYLLSTHRAQTTAVHYRIWLDIGIALEQRISRLSLRSLYLDGELDEENTAFTFCSPPLDVGYGPRGSGPAIEGSDLLFEQEQLCDAVLGRPAKRLL
jgi:hypothetical protein